MGISYFLYGFGIIIPDFYLHLHVYFGIFMLILCFSYNCRSISNYIKSSYKFKVIHFSFLVPCILLLLNIIIFMILHIYSLLQTIQNIYLSPIYFLGLLFGFRMIHLRVFLILQLLLDFLISYLLDISSFAIFFSFTGFLYGLHTSFLWSYLQHFSYIWHICCLLASCALKTTSISLLGFPFILVHLLSSCSNIKTPQTSSWSLSYLSYTFLSSSWISSMSLSSSSFTQYI